jgi:hypothetical protein
MNRKRFENFHDLLRVLSQHLIGGTEKKHKKCVRIADIPAKIQTKPPPPSPKYCVPQIAQF